MTARLTAAMLVTAMVRRMQAAGGHAAVLARGDETSGAILVALADRGRTDRFVERALGAQGYGLMSTGPADPALPGAASDYVARRRRSDPDLWVVELDGADALAIAEDVIG